MRSHFTHQSASKGLLNDEQTFRHNWTAILQQPSGGGKPWTVHVDSTNGHVLSWNDTLTTQGGQHLDPGSCSLYNFPAVKFHDQHYEDEVQRGEGLVVLEQLVKQLCKQTDFFERRDKPGALPIHAIISANNAVALDVAIHLIEQQPELLTHRHTEGRFQGEGVLHYLIVNNQRDMAARLVDIAVERLNEAKIHTMLRTHTVGSFFHELPMKHYGGSPLAYACYFGATEVVGKLLSHPKTRDIVDLNEDACSLSGFLPLHAAVASGDVSTVEFLLTLQGMSRETRNTKKAEIKRETHHGTVWDGPPKLTPVQLAVHLGDRKMTEFIIMKRAEVVWEWGPMLSLAIPLDEIDSSGLSADDAMELIAHRDARQGTKEMLLDDFMDGLFFKLFLQKWDRFARLCLVVLICLRLVVFLMLVIAGFQLRQPYEERHMGLCACVVISNLFQLCIEMIASFNWLKEACYNKVARCQIR